jgi:hypothetical protein
MTVDKDQRLIACMIEVSSRVQGDAMETRIAVPMLLLRTLENPDEAMVRIKLLNNAISEVLDKWVNDHFAAQFVAHIGPEGVTPGRKGRN